MTRDKSDKDEKKRVGFEVVRDDYELAKSKLEHGEMTQRFRELVQEIAYGTKTSERERTKRRLEELRSDERDLDREIQSLKGERDEVRRKITRAESRLDSLLEQDGEYDGTLAMLESDLRDGVRLFPDMKKVVQAAELGNTTPEGVISDLQERNPTVPETAFREAKPGEQPNWLDEEGGSFE